MSDQKDLEQPKQKVEKIFNYTTGWCMSDTHMHCKGGVSVNEKFIPCICKCHKALESAP